MDDLAARGARNMATMWSTMARAAGGRAEEWPDALAADAGAPNVVLNRTTILDAGADPADLVARVRAFYDGTGRSWGVVDPFERVDLTPFGFSQLVRMPYMALDAAAPRREPAADVVVRPVRTDDDLTDFKRALYAGFTLVPWPAGPSALFGPSLLDDSQVRLWVGTIDGVAVGSSVSVDAEGVLGVYLVAVHPDHRGRGIGEVMSWAASNAAPGKPALLQASTMGYSVYVRMGYDVLGHCPFWIPAD